jgi:tetratricopeptide (TPR) repeat protein
LLALDGKTLHRGLATLVTLCDAETGEPLVQLAQGGPGHEKNLVHRLVAALPPGTLDGAVADSTRSIEIDPSSAVAYNTRGFAKLSKGDLDGAIADFDRAIGLDPVYARAYGNRGQAKRAKGDRLGAMDDLDRAQVLQTAPRMPSR